jgi:hypothetical protein
LHWTTNKLGFDSQQWQEIYFFSKAYRLTLRPTQPHIQWVPAALCLGVKQAVHEADLSCPSTAKVRSELNYTDTPPNAIIACMGTMLLFIEHKFYKTQSRQTMLKQMHNVHMAQEKSRHFIHEQQQLESHTMDNLQWKV